MREDQRAPRDERGAYHVDADDVHAVLGEPLAGHRRGEAAGARGDLDAVLEEEVRVREALLDVAEGRGEDVEDGALGADVLRTRRDRGASAPGVDAFGAARPAREERTLTPTLKPLTYFLMGATNDGPPTTPTTVSPIPLATSAATTPARKPIWSSFQMNACQPGAEGSAGARAVSARARPGQCGRRARQRTHLDVVDRRVVGDVDDAKVDVLRAGPGRRTSVGARGEGAKRCLCDLIASYRVVQGRALDEGAVLETDADDELRRGRRRASQCPAGGCPAGRASVSAGWPATHIVAVCDGGGHHAVRLAGALAALQGGVVCGDRVRE